MFRRLLLALIIGMGATAFAPAHAQFAGLETCGPSGYTNSGAQCAPVAVPSLPQSTQQGQQTQIPTISNGSRVAPPTGSAAPAQPTQPTQTPASPDHNEFQDFVAQSLGRELPL